MQMKGPNELQAWNRKKSGISLKHKFNQHNVGQNLYIDK